MKLQWSATTNPNLPGKQWWLLKLAALYQQLDASPTGLSTSQANERIARFGPNILNPSKKHVVLQFLLRFRNPLVLLLLAASLVSAITGDVMSFAIIMAMVVLSVSLDFIQEYHAERAVEALRRSVAVKATVQRNGAAIELDVTQIVAGDVVLLSAGNLIPADGRVIEAPALHIADVSISVDSAVDVAKDAADLILLQQDLHVLFLGVLEGRRTFGNIMKYVMMATSSNFGNMFSMAGAAMFLPFLPMLPTQILLNNLLYDVSETAIPLDNVNPEDLKKPHQWDMRFIRNFMFIFGPISSVFDFLTFYVMLVVIHADQTLFRTGWFMESIATQVLVIFVIRTRHSVFKSRPNSWLVVASLSMVAVATVLPFTPLGAYFGFAPLPLLFFMLLIGMTLAYLLIVELVKHWFYRRLH